MRRIRRGERVLKSALGESVVVETKGVRTQKPRAFVGFPGPALVGSITVAQLIRSLDMREIAYLKSRLVPPVKATVGTELKTINPLRFYMNSGGNLLALFSDSPPGTVSSAAYWDVASALAKWLHSKETKEAVFLEGALTRGGGEPKTFAYCTDSQKLRGLGHLGIQPFEGIIGGIAACMIEECVARRIPWVTFLTEASANAHTLMTPDFKAAAATIDVLNKVFGLKVDAEPLRKMRVKERGRGRLQSLRSFMARVSPP